MKAEAWREMSGEDLEQKVKDLTEELFNLRFQLSMGVAKNPSRVQLARRDLARAKTILRERQLKSDKMTKTRVVKIERVYRHPRYERVITRSKRLKAHDETNASKVGDRVLIEETRPLSKDKRWRIRQVLARVSS